MDKKWCVSKRKSISANRLLPGNRLGNAPPMRPPCGVLAKKCQTRIPPTLPARRQWARHRRRSVIQVQAATRGPTGFRVVRPSGLRLYGFRDILVLKVVKRLLDTGISLQQIRAAVNHLRDRGTDDLARVTLMSDGVSVYECTSPDEVVDLLQGGQGVFGIALGRIWQE